MNSRIDQITKGLISLAVMLMLSAHAGLAWETLLAASLLACMVVFTLFNYRFPWAPRALVFMGDAGSTLLGFSIAWLAIALAMQAVMPPVLALYLIMLPLLDTAGVMWRRRSRRVSLSTPGRDHFHHLLLDAGFSVRSTATLIGAGALLMACVGLLMWHMGASEAIMFGVFVFSTISFVWLTRCPQRAQVRLGALQRLLQC